MVSAEAIVPLHTVPSRINAYWARHPEVLDAINGGNSNEAFLKAAKLLGKEDLLQAITARVGCVHRFRGPQ